MKTTHVKAHTRNQELSNADLKHAEAKGRVVTKQYRVYKFDELPEDIKEKVLEKHADINVDGSFWYESDYWVDSQIPQKFRNKDGEPLFTWKNMWFDIDRGSYVQFDGLKLKDANAEIKFLAALGMSPKSKLNIYFENSGSEVEGSGITKAEEKFSDMMHGVLSDLRKEYEYRTSREQIADALRTNEYEFNEAGEIE
jgi:hypothetical protein